MTHSFPTRRSSDLEERPAQLGHGIDEPDELARLVVGGLLDEERHVGCLGLALRAGQHQQFRLTGFEPVLAPAVADRTEEHTSELQSLMRISYAVFCLKKKNHI